MVFAPLPPGPFGVILADPPWHFTTRSAKGGGRSPSKHYGTLSLDEIFALPVIEIAAPDCALFLWVPGAHLEHALIVMKGWGFTYKSLAFVWTKPKIGLGFWTRQQAELCLLGTRGHPKRFDKSVRQVLHQNPREHSRKPDEIYAYIERLLGKQKRVELFARHRWPGWVSWGDQYER